MSRPLLPLVVLGGRDRRAPHLPAAGVGKHPLMGYKALDVRLGERPLIAVLLDRLRAAGEFEPILVAGPQRLYGPALPGVPIVDTDGGLAENIGAALAAVTALHPGAAVAFATCDILPEVEELRALVADFRSRQPCDFWLPQIRVPEDPARLGASAWKPQYRYVPRAGEPPVATLPGHLIIVDPRALRVKLILRLFELAYRTRNRPLAYRRAVMLRRVVGSLLLQDLKLLVSLRPPTATWEVVSNGLAVARALRAGNMTTEAVAALVRNIFVHPSHRRSHPERRGWLPVIEGLSLAKDVDTEEEAREMAGRLRPAG